jgi:hypothetical protein
LADGGGKEELLWDRVDADGEVVGAGTMVVPACSGVLEDVFPSLIPLAFASIAWGVPMRFAARVGDDLRIGTFVAEVCCLRSSGGDGEDDVC